MFVKTKKELVPSSRRSFYSSSIRLPISYIQRRNSLRVEYHIEFARVARLARLSENGSLQHLTRKEIEIYDKIPRDILKVSPVLLLTPLPFTNYLVFPLA
ncbi:hypothetical protein QYM36_004633, partial [Artemia franciscana]